MLDELTTDSAGGKAANSIDHLGAMLADGDPSKRRAAAREARSHPEAVPVLCARLSVEPAPSVRASILNSLAMLKSPDVVAGLIPLLRSEDTSLRNAVVEVLQEMPDEIGPFVDRMLHDEDSDARILAVNAIGGLPHADAPKWLALVIVQDPHVNVCAAAIDALAEIGDASVADWLAVAELRFPDVPYIHFAVQAALRRVRG